ncbi:MAG TPA: hypothetical protein VFN72_12900 [Solirubrobacterales bacterium]|nr:hypothetical protein [Solirubrobacterales bacterium]
MPTTTAAPATATAASRPIRRHRALAAALAVAGAAALAACGGSSGEREASGPAAPANPAAFAWVHPTPIPASWRTSHLPSGEATLAYPRTWRLIKTDPGTLTAAMRRNGTITGYLNITPQGGDETLANWASFRPAHNREEGNRNLVSVASARGLRFTNAHGSCVKDSYSTSTDRRYTEIACIVRGATATTVIVGATTPGRWNRVSPTLERAISSFQATA